MKIIGRILKYFSIAIGILIIALVLLAEFAEDPISQMALKKINRSMGTRISIEDISLSFIRDFPNARLELQNVRFCNDSLPEEDIARLSHLFVEVKLLPLIDDHFEIVEIRLEDGYARYTVDETGRSNIDFLLSPDSIAQEDTSSMHLWLLVPEIKTSAIELSYSDAQTGLRADLILDAVSSVFIKDSLGINASVDGEITLKAIDYPETKARLMEKAVIAVDADYSDDKVNINKLDIQTDGLSLNANGEINLRDHYPAQIQINPSKAQIGTLARYIPDSILTAYAIENLKGDLTFSARIEGDLTDSLYLPSIKADMLLANGSVSALNYPEISQFDAELSYDNGSYRDLQSTVVTIKNLFLKTPKSRISLRGQASNLNSPTYAMQSDLDIDLGELKPFIPADLQLHVNGKVSGSINNQGTLPQTYNLSTIEPLIDATVADLTFANLDCRMDSVIDLQNLNGALHFKNKNIQLSNLSAALPGYRMHIQPSYIRMNYTGSISDIDHMAFKVDSLNFNTDNSNLSGKAYYKNGPEPDYMLNCNARIALQDWSAFIPDTLLSAYDGTINGRIRSEGAFNMDSIADEAMRLIFENSDFSLHTRDLQVKTSDGLLELSGLNTAISYAGDSLALQQFNGSINDISFNADSSHVTNIYKALLQNKGDKLKYYGNIRLGTIDFNKVMALIPADNDQVEASENENAESSPVNLKFDLKGHLNIDRFIFNKAVFNNISALYHCTEKEYLVDRFNFEAFKGHASTSVKVQVYPNNVMKIHFKNNAQNIDIHQLLVDFDDFKAYGNEDYISHEQLSGTFSTNNLNGYFLIKDSLITDSIRMSADLKLENGKLSNYPIAMEMGQDYNVDGLDDIQFQTLETKLFVYNSAVYAPQTDIKTNTFDITLFGMEEFDLDCQYHLRFYLKEVLRKGKTDRIERKQSKESKQKDDGGTKGLTSLFAIYKVVDGETVNSFLEGKDSNMRREMQRTIKIKEALMKLEFHPLLVKYSTGLEPK